MIANMYLLLFVLCGSVLGISVGNNTSEVRSLACMSNDDCSSGNVCVDLRCEDPCLGVCGLNTVCQLVNQAPMCSCKPGYIGQPFEGCEPVEGVTGCTSNADCAEERACANRKCTDVCKDACGPHSVCKAVRHRPICSCSPGYVWSPFLGCKVQTTCITDSDCPTNQTCSKNECVDPCDGFCGNNTLCNVKNHHAACACMPGYVGNPFEECVEDSRCTLNCKKINELRVQRLSDVRSQKKYFVGNETVSWYEGAELCGKKNMSFATITSQFEQAEIEIAILDAEVPGYVWVSGCDHWVKGKYWWTSTKQNFVFTNWRPEGPPESDYDRCILLISGDYKWRTMACGRKYYYACEHFILST